MEINVVTIGGGSGSFQLLLALKRLDEVKISAIVTMADNGGSSGILRTIYGILPPGDIRNCLVALSKGTKAWRKIFSYRFDEKLDKHSLGNLILAALVDLYGSSVNCSLAVYDFVIKDTLGNSVSFSDVVSGIVKDTDGKPRNIVSNVIF